MFPIALVPGSYLYSSQEEIRVGYALLVLSYSLVPGSYLSRRHRTGRSQMIVILRWLYYVEEELYISYYSFLSSGVRLYL